MSLATLDYLLGRTDDPTPPGQGQKTPQERLREAGIEVWLRGEGLTDEDAEVIKAVMESLRKRREGKG